MDLAQTAAADVTAIGTKVVAVASAFWKKIVALGTAAESALAPVLSADEQEILLILKPLAGQLEAAALQDAIVFIKGVVAAAPTTKTASEWEVVIIELAEVAGGQIWTTLKSLSAYALQGLINLVLAQITAAAAAKAA